MKNTVDKETILGAFYETSSLGFLVLDGNGMPIAVNPALCNLLGYTEAELKIIPHTQFTVEEDAIRESWLFLQLIKGDINSYELEKRCIHKDGTIVWVYSNVSAVTEEENITCVVCLLKNITGRKDAELLLREEHTRLQNLINSATQISFIATDHTGVIKIFNSGAEQLLGYTAEEMIGKHTPQSIHLFEEMTQRSEEIREQTGRNVSGLEVFTDTARHGEYSAREWTYVRKDGSHFPVQLVVTPIKNQKNEITGFLYVATDITDFRNAQNALKLSEQRWQFALEGSGDGVWDWNAKTNEVYFSKHWKKMLGYEEHEVGITISDWDQRIHKEDKAGVYENLYRHFIGETETYVNEHRVLCKDGSYKWILDRGKVIERDKENRPVRIIGTHTDITFRKEIEKTLRKSEEQLKLFISQAPTAIAMTDKEMRYLAASEKWLIDYSMDNIAFMGKSHYEMFPQIGDEWKAIHKRCLDGHIERREEDRLVKADGSVQWIKWEVKPWFDFHGRVGGLLMFSEDVTLRKEAEEALKEAKQQAEDANRAKSEFLANMSHEIRTPMNAILGFSEVLLNTIRDETAKAHLNTIMSSGKTLLDLINDLLDLSKIESGKIELRPEPVNVTQLLQDIHRMFTPLLDKKGLHFKIAIAPGFPAGVMLDEVRLRQILINLVGNAVKFTHEGGITLAVRLDRSDAAKQLYDISISVADTGIGISEEEHKSIFEAFHQAKETTSKRYGGTGLGLTITRRLTELMGGHISLTSKPGNGSTFVVSFKDIRYAEATRPKENLFEWSQQKIRFFNSRVLVVDDVPVNVRLVEFFLKDYDLTIHKASNGKEAVEIAREVIPDLILMDLRMPQMKGEEALKILRGDEKTKNIPVIAFTASLAAEDEDTVTKKFNGALRKPAQKTELLNLLVKFLPHEALTSSDTQQYTTDVAIPDEKPDKATCAHLHTISTTFSDRCLKLADVPDLEEIDELIADLKDFCQSHNIEILSSYIAKIEETHRLFDINSTSSLLLKFPTYIKEIIDHK